MSLTALRIYTTENDCGEIDYFDWQEIDDKFPDSDTICWRKKVTIRPDPRLDDSNGYYSCYPGVKIVAGNGAV